MRVNKKLCLVVLSLLVSSCYSRPPYNSSVGWAYAVGDPILYERPLYPYYSSSNYPGYWGGYGPYYSAQAPYYQAPYYTGPSYGSNYQRVNQTGVINVMDNH